MLNTIQMGIYNFDSKCLVLNNAWICSPSKSSFRTFYQAIVGEILLNYIFAFHYKYKLRPALFACIFHYSRYIFPRKFLLKLGRNSFSLLSNFLVMCQLCKTLYYCNPLTTHTITWLLVIHLLRKVKFQQKK